MASAFADVIAPQRFVGLQPEQHLPQLVEALGHSRFEDSVLAFLESCAQIDQCAIYREEGYEFSQIWSRSNDRMGLYGESDFGTYEVRQEFRRFASDDAQVKVFCLPNTQSGAATPISVRQSILIVGRGLGALFGLKLLRCVSQHQAKETNLAKLNGLASMLVSLVARHHSLTCARFEGFNALASLAAIEDKIHSMNRLSRREAEVCARILFGFSSREIAADLGIGKESVMTYRKRAYQHLEIASQRELMLWYFEQPPSATAA